MKTAFPVVLLVSSVLVSCSPNLPLEAPDRTEAESTKELRVDPQIAEQMGIRVERITPSSADSRVSAPGRLQVNEDAAWHVGAIAAGKVVNILARVGDSVKRDQIIASIHSHEIHDSRAAYRLAVADLERQRAIVQQAQATRDRTRRLLDLRAASREQMEVAETHLRTATAAVAAAEADVNKAAVHLTEYLEVPLESPAGSHHDEGGRGTDYFQVRSPGSGTVMERRVSPGSVVTSGDTLFTVADMSTLWLIASVNETDLAQVRRGQRVSVAVKAFPERAFEGRVLQLGERLDPATRTLQVRVLVPNRGGLLKPEMYAAVDFESRGGRIALHVPEAAVQDLHGKSVVFVNIPGKGFAHREVTTGPVVNSRVEVQSGLKGGEEVVVSGAFALRSDLLKSED